MTEIEGTGEQRVKTTGSLECDHTYQSRPFTDIIHCQNCGREIKGIPRNPRGEYQDLRWERQPESPSKDEQRFWEVVEELDAQGVE